MGKLEKVPFIIELWSRVMNDELIGISKVNMSPLFNGIWNTATEKSNLSSMKSNLYPLIVYEGEPF